MLYRLIKHVPGVSPRNPIDDFVPERFPVVAVHHDHNAVALRPVRNQAGLESLVAAVMLKIPALTAL